MQKFTRQELEQQMKISPRSPLFAHLAYMHLQEGEVDLAIELCQNHMINHTKYAFGHFVLGLCQKEKGNVEEAVNELEAATYLDPNLYIGWKALHELYMNSGNKEKSDLAERFLNISFSADSATTAAEEDVFTADDFIETEEISQAFEDLTAETENAEIDLGEISFDELETGIDEEPEEGTVTDDIAGMDLTINVLEEEQEEKTVESEDVLNDEDFDFGDFEESEKEADEESSRIEEEILTDFSELEGLDLDLGEGGETKEEVIEDVTETHADEAGTEMLEGVGEVEEVGEEIAENGGEEISEGQTEEIAQPKTLTSTLGEIYISQGKFKEALKVFEALLEQKPTSKRFQRKVKELKEIIQSH